MFNPLVESNKMLADTIGKTMLMLARATSQASVQSHGVSAATLTQGQWYQQPYQQYYQNYVGDYMQQQQPMQLQSFAPQNQVIYVEVRPEVHHVAQTDHSQMQPQPQDNTVQNSLVQNTIGQCQSNQSKMSQTSHMHLGLV
ncbi:hypothetical protein Bca52824_057706 [Brassica carinata]|uniref:Uncharacterized protein n=1 Tax=Brassica carinata TaxID=52824 RepID=A0A8X7UGG2_BRACI|nr:hypothetical protein Bca52824_057706 [Brassica carinata]